MASSRVIVKNLPKHATEERLREHFATFGEVTDCRMKLTKDGRSRNFAFVGFRRETEAKQAIAKLDRSYFDTSQISVETAHAPGSEQLARPWSRYAQGSSAHSRLSAAEGAGEREAKAKAKAGAKVGSKAAQGDQELPVGKPQCAKGVTTVKVRSNKAGVASRRVHIEFGSSDEGGEKEHEGPGAPVQKDGHPHLAFDETLSDLAYLRRKTEGASTADGAPRDDSKALENGTRAKRRKRMKKRGAAPARPAEATAEAGAEPTLAVGKQEGGDRNEDRAGLQGGDGGGAEEEDLESSGRLYVTNLPFGAAEEEVQAHFETLGEVSSVYICKDEDSLKSRGFGYVSYVFPECAVRALAELDLKSFQGRLLRIAAAQAKPALAAPAGAEPFGALGGRSSYKRRLAERRKQIDAHVEQTWNLLYVSANAAADAASSQARVAKAELFGKDSENAAVTAALTETSIIQQTKRWLQQEGIRFEAFEAAGASLTKSKAVDASDGQRRDDTFLVKHLPARANAQELRERFARHGELLRCSLAPSGTVAVVQYGDKAHAQRAFQKLAFARYQHVPLYLEWAPPEVFSRPAAASEGEQGARGREEENAAVEEDADEVSRGYLFVKNLNFATTDAVLTSAFNGCKGFRSAVVVKKKAAVAKGASNSSKPLSMGYAFLEFDGAASAEEALKHRQGVLLDGHAVQLQRSARGSGGRQGRSGAVRAPKTRGPLATQRLCVRNLAFEATRRELQQLFGAYGSVAAVRIPKKSDYSGHRGFAFIDFASKSEAAAAYEALQHTHLYGRRMVIEPAEEKANDVEAAQQAAQRRQASHALRSEATKRRRLGVLNAGEQRPFEDVTR